MDLHFVGEQALSGMRGWAREKVGGGGGESLHCRLINLNSAPRTPYGFSGVELSKTDQSDLPLSIAFS